MMTNMIFPPPINNEVPHGTPGSTPVMQMSFPENARIPTIKALRNEFNWGLKQAKEFMECGIVVKTSYDMCRVGNLQYRLLIAMKQEGLPAPTFRWVGQARKTHGGEPVTFAGAEVGYDVEFVT